LNGRREEINEGERPGRDLEIRRRAVYVEKKGESAIRTRRKRKREGGEKRERRRNEQRTIR